MPSRTGPHTGRGCAEPLPGSPCPLRQCWSTPVSGQTDARPRGRDGPTQPLVRRAGGHPSRRTAQATVATRSGQAAARRRLWAGGAWQAFPAVSAPRPGQQSGHAGRARDGVDSSTRALVARIRAQVVPFGPRGASRPDRSIRAPPQEPRPTHQLHTALTGSTCAFIVFLPASFATHSVPFPPPTAL